MDTIILYLGRERIWITVFKVLLNVKEMLLPLLQVLEKYFNPQMEAQDEEIKVLTLSFICKKGKEVLFSLTSRISPAPSPQHVHHWLIYKPATPLH